MENPGVERIPVYASIDVRLSCDEILFRPTPRRNERGCCGGDGCTARRDSDATATACSLLRQLTPPVATFSLVSSFPSLLP
uniref:Uncharacterized protein n=1 Tax=Oryza glumipatula TaxID=40148 RepID=A0A0E0B055_9ORYZ